MIPGRAPLGILGGTFDPVHYGHLRPAVELLEALNLAELRLVPGRIPPHRPPPRVSPHRRLEVLTEAVRAMPGLRVDDRELHRGGPSYTVDTLRTLREEIGERPLCFALGSDAFLGLPRWYRWEALTDYAHLVVMERPGHPTRLGGGFGEWAMARRADSASALRDAPAGRILFMPVTQLDISATGVRRLLACGESARCLMPEPAWRLIAENGWYGYPQV
ncbi:putative nicotinate-nucleotide adenylyltransferase [wastewater metagenome]|uniref:Putative nicotinate-nucleotide adenylyltransferase n=2 Tax=unclassified sequences TaxID=12908 RepID=A0A5B8RCT2_9ZZZZ|nr:MULTISPECIES: nicotinate-nucleotide adenylyltransferase [Arhodomonas]MCS4505005.1 nicotinate-nucleotide adenylyltransferase [Arhodomonas aquaeolei]QEA05232.1 putative nicotinate-nucleotide adenylyltransferase [uncultured organism]